MSDGGAAIALDEVGAVEAVCWVEEVMILLRRLFCQMIRAVPEIVYWRESESQPGDEFHRCIANDETALERDDSPDGVG